MPEYVRTTIKLREDIFQKLKKEAGKRGISETINKILEERLIKRRSLFGTMPRVDTSDIRDHEDRV
jgi:predicted CopG family antitoxin